MWGTITINSNSSPSCSLCGLVIGNGASYTLGGSQTITGNGPLTNNGQLYVTAGNLTLSGSFINNATGTLNLDGNPNLTFEGTTFINNGNIYASFNSSNSLPQIFITATSPNVSLSDGIIIINYNNNYIATNTYNFITVEHSTSVPIGAYILPQPTFYISDFTLTTEVVGTSTIVQVSVIRDGFNEHALTTSAQEIGLYLENIGSNNPSAAELTLLNSLEQITNDEELTIALESLLPPQYTALTTVDLLDSVVGALDIRLATVQSNYKFGYTSGDVVTADANSFWVRPFTSNGKQQTTSEVTGFSDTSNGWVIGVDRNINNNLILGVAGSISRTNVTQTSNTTTTTRINNYEFSFYGTYITQDEAYVDGIILGGISNYHGLRTIVLPDFNAAASANYSSQQFTVKLMASKNFAVDLWQITPKAMAQYSFIRQLPYSETGAYPYDMYVDPSNINLFRLGAGTSIGIPFIGKKMLSIPSALAMFYVDAKGGINTVNCQFVTGGPFLTNTSEQSRIMIKLGLTYELKLSDTVQIIAGYDYIIRRYFQGHDAYLNLRYIF